MAKRIREATLYFDLIPVQILHMVNNSNTVMASLRDAVLQIFGVALSYNDQCLGMYVQPRGCTA